MISKEEWMILKQKESYGMYVELYKRMDALEQRLQRVEMQTGCF